VAGGEGKGETKRAYSLCFKRDEGGRLEELERGRERERASERESKRTGG
jgi:hypothetical protein